MNSDLIIKNKVSERIKVLLAPPPCGGASPRTTLPIDQPDNKPLERFKKNEASSARKKYSHTSIKV